MDIDFSSLNLQYLIQARDIARKRPEAAAVVLGLPIELVRLFASLKAETLSKIVRVTEPLLMLRGNPGWWLRLFTALKEHRPGEVEAVLAHASLAVMTQS